MIPITDKLALDEDELSFSFTLSSGPGGQNVNRVASAVQLRFDVRASQSLPESVKSRLLKIAANRINQDGVLLIEAKNHRSQAQNRREAVERLCALIERAARKPKKRRPTKPSKAAKQRRLDEKKKRSEKKRRRQSDDPR